MQGQIGECAIGGLGRNGSIMDGRDRILEGL